MSIFTNQKQIDNAIKAADDNFKKWKKKNKEERYGQKEQEELNASYKQSLANKKERENK
jgi:hypothetical protein